MKPVKSAYQESEWIDKLVTYVKDVAERKPKVKIIGKPAKLNLLDNLCDPVGTIGICFGHQIIARALGGTCVSNNGVWEIGPSSIKLSEVGKRVFGGAKETLVCPLTSLPRYHLTHYTGLEHPTMSPRPCPSGPNPPIPIPMSWFIRHLRESRHGPLRGPRFRAVPVLASLPGRSGQGAPATDPHIHITGPPGIPRIDCEADSRYP